MKKGTVIALIVAAVLIVFGTGLAVLGFIGGSFTQEEKYSNQQEMEYFFTDSFESIHIDVDVSDVTFAVSGSDECRVVCKESDRVYHKVWADDGVLTIKVVDERKWFDHIGIFWDDMKVEVYLPEGAYTSLHVETDTGFVEVPEGFSFEQVMLDSDTGRLSYMSDAGKHIQLSTDTGSITLNNVWADQVETDTDTGATRIGDIQCRTLSSESATGRIELERVMVEEHMELESDTGDITITDSDAAAVHLETATGDISGSFLTPKLFEAHSQTGKVQIPNSGGGGICEVRSDTGDIWFQ